MSYDIYLRSDPCPHCGRRDEEPDCPDPTYNLTPIFDLALTDEPLPNASTSEAAVVLLRAPTDRPRGLRLLSGRKARETLPDITRALERLRDPSRCAALTALEPDNKWGTVPDAIWVFERLRELAEEHPDGTWEIH